MAGSASGGVGQRQTKAQATTSVNLVLRNRSQEEMKSLRFSSFFSKAAITQLLAGRAVTGIRFFIVPLPSTAFHTHLGVAFDGTTELSQTDSQGTASHIVCNNPCPGPPGGCAIVVPPQAAQLESISLSTPNAATEPQIDRVKYLVIW